MTIREWIEIAPDNIREEMQSILVMNFLRQQRNDRFQSIGAYDGAMSEACKELNRSAYSALVELIDALEQTMRDPAPYNPYAT